MAQPTVEDAQDPRGVRDTVSFENFVASRIGLPPIATGLLITGVLFGAFLVVQWALGLPVWIGDSGNGLFLVHAARLTFFVAALIGFSMAANLYLPRAIYRDQVSSLIDEPERRRALLEFDPLVLQAAVVRRSRVAGLVGVALAIAVVVLVTPTSREEFDPAYLPVTVLTPLLLWILARSTFSTITGAATPAEFHREIDLFDLRPHYVAGRIGLRMALVWLAGTAISVLLLATTGFSLVLLPLSLGGIFIGAVAFVLPVRGVQLRIRAEKRAALDALQPELRDALAAHQSGNTEPVGRLADLLALRGYLEGIREWPFDNSTLWRFALYALIPLGSWLGGALVERALELVVP